jgi:SSS family solute:Na+ symporter/sodium/pantothenate symporter
MEKETIAWIVFSVYLVGTAGLALRGMMKTKDLEGFALGKRDMGPAMVGVALAAAIASSATFIINPGFVYHFGVSALLHYGVAASMGVSVGLIVMSKGFRRHGQATRALTLPHWIGARYQSPGLRTYFAILNLLLAITFVVLIIKGSAGVMQETLGLSYTASVTVIVAFVFSYILIGGTYAHVYTNMLQGLMMILVAAVLIGSGFHLLGDGVGAFGDQLAAQDPKLLDAFRPDSGLFTSGWDVLICPFIIGFALVCQPHILTKSLYLKTDRDVNRYLLVSVLVGTIFAAILVVGLWARATLGSGVAPDQVVANYIHVAFSDGVAIFIAVALLAAGMSTLDGILVGASAIAGNDLFLGALGDKLMRGVPQVERERRALAASRWVLVAMGVISFLIALDPPYLVGLFGQMGIYGLVTASLAPLVLGIFVKEINKYDATAAAVVGPLVHFAHYGTVTWINGAFINPSVTATEGIVASFIVLGGLTLLRRRHKGRQLAVEPATGE